MVPSVLLRDISKFFTQYYVSYLIKTSIEDNLLFSISTTFHTNYNIHLGIIS